MSDGTATMTEPKTNPVLVNLLEKAARHVMTPREIWDQRVSWACGQLKGNEVIPRARVEAVAIQLYGPRP